MVFWRGGTRMSASSMTLEYIADVESTALTLPVTRNIKVRNLLCKCINLEVLPMGLNGIFNAQESIPCLAFLALCQPFKKRWALFEQHFQRMLMTQSRCAFPLPRLKQSPKEACYNTRATCQSLARLSFPPCDKASLPSR